MVASPPEAAAPAPVFGTPPLHVAKALVLQLFPFVQSVLAQPTQFLTASVNVACARIPLVPPSAVSTNRVPRSSWSGANIVSVKLPDPSATATQLLSGSSSGSSCSVIVTVSPAAQPLPWIVTVSPGA